MHVPESVTAYPQFSGTTSFPWFKALFDQNFFDSGVDIFFNFLLFYVPAGLLGWTVTARVKKGLSDTERQRLRSRFIGIVSLVGLILFCVVYFAKFRQPYVDYASVAALDGTNVIFPLIEYSYRDIDLMAVSQGPSLEHLLGTDREGRDVFTRLIYGTRISLTIGVVAVSIYTSIGLVLGSLAGFFGGRVDSIILRMIEIMMCFPVLFLILTLAGFIEEPSIFHIMLIIGLTGWTGIARLVRGEFLRLRNQDFVQAAIALGFTQARIIFRHVLPNAVQPVFVSATFGVAGAILIEATLSFLGVGPANAPSWGQILTSGRNTQQMTLILSSGFAIFLTISLLNLIGEGLRDATDPKLRK
ncbi:peptide ABC transporter permease [Lujinxingia litoralis]|uniref:Peptide ABC transporter permease n=2 Tax=Lujinxingia litoralis TaxID=2211119 RepID=A0A328CEF7_9DELT|nr:peptide ABC transporter permease [Lujinxingia litoralis]